MMHPLKTLLLLASMVTLIACDRDDEHADPTPAEKRLRASKIAYGEIAYRVMEYDNQHTLSAIISGVIGDGDTVETRHEIVYNQGKPIKLIVRDNWELRYSYTRSFLTETNEFIDGELFQQNIYEYNKNGLVTTWFAFQPDEQGEVVPFTKTTYEYNASRNVTRARLFTYLPDTKEYKNFTTTEYEDFDNKKNPFKEFWGIMDNPMHVMFVNNPRMVRVINDNGSQAESHYTLQYNEAGFVTKQEVAEGGHTIEYSFEEY